MNPTPEQVADAGRVLRHTTFCHRRTAIRPANDTEAKAIAVVWAKIFARHNLTLDDLLAAVELRAETEAASPEPAEIVAVARRIRLERSDREQADPEKRALREARIDQKIAGFAANLGRQLS